MSSGRLIFTIGSIAGAALLMAADQPSALAQVKPGLWEIDGAPGAKAMAKECVGDVLMLARYEHRKGSCSAKVLKDAGTKAVIHYTCSGGGFGQTQIDVITPRNLRISTQGISDGLPFNYVLQARRAGECAKSTTASRH